MKKYMGLILAGILAVTAAGCGKTETAETTQENDTTVQTEEILQAELPAEGDEIAVITTTQGVIKMMFYPEEAPKAVENFKTLAKEGYYDGVIFHRVIEDFMVQTGDPEGTGLGGESCWGEPFEDEISPKLHFYNGAVAMANKGANTNGSQFFIVQSDTVNQEYLDALVQARDENEDLGISVGDQFYTMNQWFPDSVLDYYKEHGGAIHLEYAFGNPYTIFGQVIEGMDVVNAIAAAETDENDKPVEDIVIESITFEPYAAE
ncbi:peptidylprolyl isomerase [Anaerotignum lactatifermentans]|uniref:Peptidyl-prolyl cis-trans isomerase n=1 Tax=Anaerotignum lactatifermentans TaxID=160404 RepID=A0ABS2GC06_9FIRM|nr:peptidylprolyl isomerase [Anaerotignum lactatifermentans]MBM6829535.1 peptidylprolyl isomerase [Anaerotignum lactatifermentans]MBM6878029.1 peptidylprolyl isomerase [Anaerotignum lactatifermentans]MBM6951141.1 peptidylprolyl isomerase [Anaerotignum lactatifermentans]